MNLQEKTALTLVVILIALIFFIGIFTSAVLLSSYGSLEEEYIVKDLHRAVNKMEDEMNTLSSLVSDWGVSDDTVDFVNGKKPGYIQANILPDTFNNLRLNLFVITNTRGEIIYSGAYDLQNRTMVAVPALFYRKIGPGNPLMNMTDPRHANIGIVMLSFHPMIVASRPIVHTDFSGTPQGVVIMGRYLDQDEIDHLSQLTQLNLEFSPADDPALSPDLISFLKKDIHEKPEVVLPVNRDYAAGYTLIRDIYGNDALVLEIVQPRDIYQQGITTTFHFVLIILSAGLVFGVVALVILDRFVLSRLEELSVQVESIGKDKEISKRVHIAGDDEFSGLAAEINRMLDTIQRTQQIVQQSEARFRDLAELLPLVIFEMDTDGTLTYINKFGLEMFGMTALDFAEKRRADEFIVPEDHARMYDNLKRIAGGERALGEIYTLQKKDGAKIRAIIHTASIVHNGSPVGFRGCLVDISERLKLEETLAGSEQKYRALAESTADIIFSTDMTGTVTYISPQVGQYGYSVQEVVGRSIFDFVHPDEKAGLLENFRRELGGDTSSVSTFRVFDKWGNIHWMEEKSSLRTDLSGKTAGINGILRDITERMKAQDAVALANKKLNLMNNITRHDILNTLTGLFGCVDMARASASQEERDQLLADIKELSRTIQRQIEFTRIYQAIGVKEPAWQNISQIIHHIADPFAGSKVSIINDISGIEVYADPLLEKVFYNLVQNALSYGERITAIRFTEQISDRGFAIICEDDGIGIPAEMKEKIFERGIGQHTGMGLFLAREILGITSIAIHENGTFGKGARFEIMITKGGYRVFTTRNG